MDPFAAAASGLGAVLSFVGGERRNRAQQRLAERQMDFQKEMSNTAYQRAMDDMSAAGLNPILAGKLGGASTPAGAMPQLHDTITPALSSAMNIVQTGSDANLKKAQTELTKTNELLAEKLVPGASAVEKVTTQVNNMVSAIDGLVGQQKAGYDKMLKQMEIKLGDLIDRLIERGVETQQIFINIKNKVGEIKDETKEFLYDIMP